MKPYVMMLWLLFSTLGHAQWSEFASHLAGRCNGKVR